MIIEVKNITHTYMPNTAFSKTAIEDINFNVDEGEFIGLIGHSGCGKSTLIQHLNGLLMPTSGSIIIDNENITNDKNKLRDVRFKVGLVFQYPEQQLFEETVFDDIAYGPRNMKLEEDEVKKRVYEAIKLVGIKEKNLQKSPFELSGGQKRRVAIAGVIAMKPRILILDEPTAGLDPKGRNEILTNIKKLHETTNMTVILVSHSMEDIANNVERIIVMNEGHIMMDGKKEEVFSKGDELIQIGLNVPQITTVFHKLKERGYNVPTNIYTVDGAKEFFKALVEKKGE